MRILRAYADETETNKDLAQKISKRISSTSVTKQEKTIDLNPFQIYSENGEAGLSDSLNKLDLKQLNRVIGEHRLDSSDLSRKWRNKERLVKFIVERIASRSQHEDVFLHETK